jgi:Tfp pilus assembly protein PilN
MINLLPPDTKKQIMAARTNTVLVRYVLMFSTVFMLTLGAFGAGFYFSAREKTLAQDALQMENAKTAKYSDIKAKAEDFAKDLATAKSVFSNGVSYSQLLLDIAEVVPAGSVINNLSLTSSTFGTPLTITGQTKTLADVEKLKVSLEQSSLFENVSTGSVTIGDAGGANDSGNGSEKTDYPISVTLSATLSKPQEGVQ